MHDNRDRAALSLATLSLGGALLLGACGGTVEGRMLHTPETFTGDSTAGVAGEGRIELTSSAGAQCHGPYRQVPDDNGGEVGADHAEENGHATLTCSDGRKGMVMFNVGADQAVGTGMLGRDIVTLTIVE
jgi:hypothetical protein